MRALAFARATQVTARHAVVLAIWALCLGAAPVACSLSTDFGGLTGGDAGSDSDGARADATQANDAADAVDSRDGTSDAEADAGGNADSGVADTGADADAASMADAPCASEAGPAMVEANSQDGVRYCIDSTEVTQSEYQAFLFATAGNTSGQDPRCTWNNSYASTCGFDPATTPDLPVTCIDWCDALAFCAWSGKRLCGRVGGGTLPDSEVIDPTKSQWFAACSKDAVEAYPYGNTYVATACNTGDNDAGAAWNAGSHPACQGGFPGVFDMSGNVGEWEDLCYETDAGAGAASCAYRGGVYHDPGTSSWLRCDNGGGGALEIATRSQRFVDIGFRCCRD